ncbi:MAG: hypothetical protein V2A66_00270 [Pseudomonadota bacterium]
MAIASIEQPRRYLSMHRLAAALHHFAAPVISGQLISKQISLARHVHTKGVVF